MTPDARPLSDEHLLRLNAVCNSFEAAWKSGERPSVETWLEQVPAELRAAALAELLTLEIEYRRRGGDAAGLDELAARFPDVDHDWLKSRCDQPAAAPTLDVPEQLGDYRILERIGGGGMGTVYKAVHQRMGRTVALKVLRRGLQRDPDLQQRFDREVRAAARLTHPNIVAALDAREQDGLHCLITEFVEGCDLEETVRRRGPLPVGAAVDCIVQAARGLDYAHRRGVVHRDIKPANLLRGEDGVVKVLDMGLARLDASDDAAPDALTKTGMVMGTAAYMAPEQARDTRRADARSDVYSLGCTLYFLLSGRPLFVGATAVDTILSHVSQPVPALSTAAPSIPSGLEAAFRRMVAKEPADRFQSAAEVIAALEPFRADAAAGDWPTATPKTAVGGPTRAGADPAATTPPLSSPASVAIEVSPPAEKSGLTSVPGRRGMLIVAGVILSVLFAAWGATLLRGVAPVVSDFALEFNGRSSYVAVPDLTPAAGETYTLEFLAQPEELRTSNVISWLGPDWMAIFLGQDGRWGLARRWQGASHLVGGRTRTELGRRVHVAGVFDGGDLRLFIDGRPTPTGPIAHQLPERSGGLYLGGADLNRLPEDRFFRGLISGVRISRGVRYTGPFDVPATLTADPDTLGLFLFPEGRGAQTRSSDSRRWTGDIIDAAWRPAAP